MERAQTLPTIPALLIRERDASHQLGISPSLFRRLVRRGLLTPVRPPGTTRAVRYVAAEVQALGEQWIADAGRTRDEAQH